MSVFSFCSITKKGCEGRDSNPWTPTGAGLKPAAFGQAQPPSRIRSFTARGKVDFDYRVTRAVTDPIASMFALTLSPGLMGTAPGVPVMMIVPGSRVVA